MAEQAITLLELADHLEEHSQDFTAGDAFLYAQAIRETLDRLNKLEYERPRPGDVIIRVVPGTRRWIARWQDSKEGTYSNMQLYGIGNRPNQALTHLQAETYAWNRKRAKIHRNVVRQRARAEGVKLWWLL